MITNNKMNCAIIGTGKIGLDTYFKCLKSKVFKNIKIYNLNPKSEGAKFCKRKKLKYFSKGINGIYKNIYNTDVIFDATSAKSNKKNFKKLKKFLKKNKIMVNLTPSNTGQFYVPYLKKQKMPNVINLITCGGQSSIPIAKEIKEKFKKIKYFELVSAISSKSAGYATRQNVNEYIENTKQAIRKTCKLKNVKVFFNLNPSEPPVTMSNSLYFQLDKGIKKKDMQIVKRILHKVNKYMKKIIPGYHSKLIGIMEKNVFKISIKVLGQGDYLPSYAGNLDIITSVGVNYAKQFFEKKYNNK